MSPEIRRAIEEMGYENPMPVQEEVIPYLLGENNDIVALAQTGTGKTAAFGLPLIQKIDVKQRIPQSLILCPTRELCLQIAGDLSDYSKLHRPVCRVLPVIWRFVHRQPDTRTKTRRAYHCSHSRTID